jgi:hypothetical protein
VDNKSDSFYLQVYDTLHELLNRERAIRYQLEQRIEILESQPKNPLPKELSVSIQMAIDAWTMPCDQFAAKYGLVGQQWGCTLKQAWENYK